MHYDTVENQFFHNIETGWFSLIPCVCRKKKQMRLLNSLGKIQSFSQFQIFSQFRIIQIEEYLILLNDSAGEFKLLLERKYIYVMISPYKIDCIEFD